MTAWQKRYEVLDGQTVPARRRSMEHTLVAPVLRTFLDVFVVKRGLGSVLAGPVEVRLSETDVTRPEVVFVARERENIIAEDVVRGAPDLIVEIFALSKGNGDKCARRAIYARHDVREYWLVDPDEESVTVLLLGDGGYAVSGIFGEGQTLRSPTLEGLRLGVGGRRTSWSVRIAAQHGRIGYDDYQRTPDDERYELLDGMLITRG